MGRALEVIAGSATAPGATLTAMTAFAGNTYTVRSFPFESRAELLQAWADAQAAGTFRVRSPRLHDNVQGLRFDTQAGVVHPLLPYVARQPLFPQDQLTAEIAGSATAGDAEVGVLLVYYEDLPGIDARLFNVDEVLARVVNIVPVFNSISKGASIGYSGEEAIDENDLLKANTEYAILGGYVDTEVAVVRIRGPETGNLGLGFPGDTDVDHVTANWFAWLSMQSGLPCVPVFNAANRDNTLIDVGGDENSATVGVTTILAELA